MGYVMMENKHGLAVSAALTHVNGTAEREATLLGADKAYDAWAFKDALKARGIIPHIARRTDKTWDGLTVSEPAGYLISLRCCKRIEEIFSWTKTIAGQAKTKFRGRKRVEASFNLAIIACNLVRLPKLLDGATP